MNSWDNQWISKELFDAAEEIESALPVVVTSESSDFSPEAVDDLFAHVTSRLSPLETEGLGNALRQVGRWANDRAQLGQLASAVLPAAGTAVGTAYGGPLGGTLGRTIGERARQAIAGGMRHAAPRTPAGTPSATAPQTPLPTQAGGDGSTAAAKLLYLVQNPSFLSSLVALALGSQGQSTIPVGAGDKQVPVGAFMNLVTNLAGQAAQNADALVGDAESLPDSYLRSDTGRLSYDPAVPAQRADALLRLLQQEDEAASMLGEMFGEAWEDDVDSESWSGDW